MNPAFLRGCYKLRSVNLHTWECALHAVAGSSESEVLPCIGISGNCLMLLEKHLWKAHIRGDMKIKIRLYRTYVLWVLMYGSKSWIVVKTLVR